MRPALSSWVAKMTRDLTNAPVSTQLELCEPALIVRSLISQLAWYFYFMAPFGLIGGILMMSILGRVTLARLKC